LEAGTEKEYSLKQIITNLPPKMIMTYTIHKDIFMEIVDKYPRVRSFLVTRSVLRRAYFSRIFEENKQIVLMKKKQAQHRILCDQ
jgi:signal-transduction protein with cAMP-binding, CBS, and nucleotidyltransferase domain